MMIDDEETGEIVPAERVRAETPEEFAAYAGELQAAQAAVIAANPELAALVAALASEGGEHPSKATLPTDSTRKQPMTDAEKAEWAIKDKARLDALAVTTREKRAALKQARREAAQEEAREKIAATVADILPDLSPRKKAKAFANAMLDPMLDVMAEVALNKMELGGARFNAAREIASMSTGTMADYLEPIDKALSSMDHPEACKFIMDLVTTGNISTTHADKLISYSEARTNSRVAELEKIVAELMAVAGIPDPDNTVKPASRTVQ